MFRIHLLFGEVMKRSILSSVLLASVILPLAGCSMWPGNRTSDNRKGAMTMEQCRSHMAMTGNPSTRQDDAMTKRTAECNAMMRK